MSLPPSFYLSNFTCTPLPLEEQLLWVSQEHREAQHSLFCSQEAWGWPAGLKALHFGARFQTSGSMLSSDLILKQIYFWNHQLGKEGMKKALLNLKNPVGVCKNCSRLLGVSVRWKRDMCPPLYFHIMYTLLAPCCQARFLSESRLLTACPPVGGDCLLQPTRHGVCLPLSCTQLSAAHRCTSSCPRLPFAAQIVMICCPAPRKIYARA